MVISDINLNFWTFVIENIKTCINQDELLQQILSIQTRNQFKYFYTYNIFNLFEQVLDINQFWSDINRSDIDQIYEYQISKPIPALPMVRVPCSINNQVASQVVQVLNQLELLLASQLNRKFISQNVRLHHVTNKVVQKFIHSTSNHFGDFALYEWFLVTFSLYIYIPIFRTNATCGQNEVVSLSYRNNVFDLVSLELLFHVF